MPPRSVRVVRGSLRRRGGILSAYESRAHRGSAHARRSSCHTVMRPCRPRTSRGVGPRSADTRSAVGLCVGDVGRHDARGGYAVECFVAVEPSHGSGEIPIGGEGVYERCRLAWEPERVERRSSRRLGNVLPKHGDGLSFDCIGSVPSAPILIDFANPEPPERARSDERNGERRTSCTARESEPTRGRIRRRVPPVPRGNTAR